MWLPDSVTLDERLIESVRQNKTPPIIHFQNEDLPPDLVASFFEAMAHNTSVKELHFTGATYTSELGDKGAAACGEMLKTNRTLEVLSIIDHNIGAPGANAIADGLYENRSLKSLRLPSNPGNLNDCDRQHNHIQDMGFIALAHAAAANNTLTSLDVEGFHNAITTSGAIGAGHALKGNNRLAELRMGHSFANRKIEPAGLKALHDAFKDSKNLAYAYGLDGALDDICNVNKGFALSLMIMLRRGVDDLSTNQCQTIQECRPAILAVAKNEHHFKEDDLAKLNALLDEVEAKLNPTHVMKLDLRKQLPPGKGI